MTHVHRVQEAGEHRGRIERVGDPRVRLPVLGARVAHDVRKDRGDTAFVARHRCEVRARARHQLGRRGADVAKDPERHVDVDRLTQWTAKIRLEGVAKATVVVLVRMQRLHDSFGRTPRQPALEQQSVDQPRVAPDEVTGMVDVDVCHVREVTCFGTASAGTTCVRSIQVITSEATRSPSARAPPANRLHCAC